MAVSPSWKRRTLAALACCAVLRAPLGLRTLSAAPPSTADVERAEEEQDRQLAEARRGGSTASVVTGAQSKVLRSPTPLNLYLLGRAQYHHGDRVGALKSMLEVSSAEPGFHAAHVRLAILYWLDKNAALARQHLDQARAGMPDAPEVLRLSAEIGAGTKDYALALGALRRLSAREPEDLSVRMALAEVLGLQGDWAGAYQELRVLRAQQPKAARVRWLYAHAALETKRHAEAAQELEALAKEDPQGVPYLDLLRRVYAETKDWQRLAGALERLRPFIKPEERERLDTTITALRSGRVPGEGPAPETPQVDPVVELFERCLSPDVATRRAALQEFHGSEVGWIPGAVLMRYHPREEPDPECRVWVLRIVGRLVEGDMTAKVPGHALQDPESLVRRVAAETLGEIGTPAGVLYLLAYVPDLALTAQAPKAVVEEYNAARAALVSLTHHDDLPVGSDGWVPAEGLEASWRGWSEWFAAPEGVQSKLRAIEDLVRTGETHPEWYLLVQVYDASPRVAFAAYQALLARAGQPTEDPLGKRLWPAFPRATPQESTPEGLPGLRTRIKTWWSSWLAERVSEPK